MGLKAKELEAALHGEGCLGRSHDDEPVFVLCARDQIASSAVRDWAERAIARRVNGPKIGEALAVADAMDEWRVAHGGGKLPD